MDDDGHGDARQVREALAELEPLDREALVLHVRDRLSIDEIASLTASAPDVVARRVRRVARAVEATTGPSVGRSPVALDDRDEDEAIADIALGITPQLAARLRRAVTTGEVPVLSATERSRRRLQVESWLHERAPSLLGLATVASIATVMAVSVVGPV